MVCLKKTVFLMCVIVLAAARSTSDLDIAYSPRIVGGDEASDGIAPYLVSLRYSYHDSHFCSGSILNKRWVLSAGHCLKGKTANMIVAVTGTNLLSHGGDKYQGDKITVHKEYNRSQIKNDIALLRLQGDIKFTALVQPIELAAQLTQVNAKLIVTGWGKSSRAGGSPDRLQLLNVRVFDKNKCRKMLKAWAPIFESQICTFTIKGEGTCHGDSGGPLVEDGQLAGIVSWGVPCGRGYPDVFVSVYAFRSWIADNMES